MIKALINDSACTFHMGVSFSLENLFTHYKYVKRDKILDWWIMIGFKKQQICIKLI